MHTRCWELQEECVLFIVAVYISKFSLLSDPRAALPLVVAPGELLPMTQSSEGKELRFLLIIKL